MIPSPPPDEVYRAGIKSIASQDDKTFCADNSRVTSAVLQIITTPVRGWYWFGRAQVLVDSGLPPFLWGELMMTASHLCNRIPHSALKMETPQNMLYGKTPNFRTSESSARGCLFISKRPTNSVTRRGKKRCVALAGTRETHFVFTTPRRVELSKTRTPSSSKHHRPYFPFPGGFRHDRVWKLQLLTSVTTVSTATTLRVKTCYTMV